MLYHVMGRGNAKACIFTDDDDYRRFLARLRPALSRFGCSCLAYCALWNHYHLLLEAGQLPVSRLMQQLNSSYCQGFNRRHGRVGHVLQGRYRGYLVEDGSYARNVLRYIALNPVAAGLARDPADWRWSSYRAVMRSTPETEWLACDRVWRLFGAADPVMGRSRFAAWVTEDVQDARNNSLFWGSEALAQRLAPLIEPLQTKRDYVRPQRYATRPSLRTLFRGANGRKTAAEAAAVAFHRHAYTLADIGQHVGRHPSTIWRWIHGVRS